MNTPETSPIHNRGARLTKIFAGASASYDNFMEKLIKGSPMLWDGQTGNPTGAEQPISQPPVADPNPRPLEARAMPLERDQQ